MAEKRKILIVDDDGDFVKSTVMILEKNGYETAVANDGKQGLEKIRENPPDLVILDIMMESIFEGYSFLGVLKSAPEFAAYRAIPVLMVSSVKRDTGSRFMFDEDSGLGDMHQPEDYMDKPLKAAKFLEKVSAMLQKSG